MPSTPAFSAPDHRVCQLMGGVLQDAVVDPKPHPGRSMMIGLNAAAVIVAGLYFGRELLVPLVLASLLAFVLAPACALLRRVRIPRVLAVLLVVIFAFGVLGGIGTIVGRQLGALAGDLPRYETTVMAKWHALTANGGLLGRFGIATPRTHDHAKAEGSAKPVHDGGSGVGLGNATGLSVARTVAEPLLGPLATAGVVLVFTIFILISNEDLRDRLVRLVGRRDLHRTILAMNDAAGRLSRYFLCQLGLNSAFGTLVGTGLWLIGLPDPLLWGILAALMRFVPFIGVFIALAPPLLLALAVVPGWSLAIVVVALFVGTDLIMGQVVEPLIYGHSTGLSPIAVIVSAAFWALLWGPVGLLLATPLTVCLVVIGRHVEPLAFLDVILGDTPPLEAAETFYQRALEGRASVLIDDARGRIRSSSLSEYYDAVALRGLALAQGDLIRDTLAFERLEAIHTQIAGLLANLEGTRDVAAGPPLPSSWQASGAILCVPGRGQLDDLAADMAVQVLQAAGLAARTETNLILGASAVLPTGIDETRLCCLSVLEEGSTSSGVRYYLARVRKIMPNAMIAVCLWHARSDSPLLADLRVHGADEHLVVSIGELVALARVLISRTSGITSDPSI